MWQAGEIVAGRYRLERVLGVGGTAVVHLARRLEDGELVAIKRLMDARSRTLPKRFAREGRIASRIRHPNVVRLLDLGQDQRGNHFLVMEVIDGAPLGSLITTRLDAGAYCTLAVQVLDALAHVHAHGVLHRDIKPENLLVLRQPDGTLSVKVTDFGVATAADEGGFRLTAPGLMVGTPDFLAPEQLGKTPLLTPSVDVYALGLTLYEALSGELPFSGPLQERLLARLEREAPPLTARSGIVIPPGLDRVIAKMLARQPEDRYGTAADARSALAPFSSEARLSEAEWDEVVGPRESAQLEPKQLANGFEPAARCHGRDRELARLDELAREVEAGAGRVILLAGAPGIGKSALMREIAIELAESGRFGAMHGSYQEAAGIEVGVRGAFERMLGVAGDRRTVVEARVRELLRRSGDVEEREVQAGVEFLRPGRAIESGGAQESFALAVRLLRRIARERPVLLTLEDVHDGGAAAAGFLEHVLFEASYEPFPILVLATLRPKEADPLFDRVLARTDRYEGGARHTIRLERMEAGALVNMLRQRTDVSLGEARSVARRADGNPLFALLLAGTSLPSTSARIESGASDGPDLPPALRELLERSLRQRLERTDEADGLLELLALMAVAGERVGYGLLEELAQELVRDVDRAVQRLVELDVLSENTPDEVAFAHGLVREAILAGLSPRRLRRYHLALAEARERHAGSRIGAEAGPIGDHLAAAGERERAIDYWRRALAHEAAAGDAGRGVAWGRRLLEALDAADPTRPGCAMDLARLLRNVGEVSEAAARLEPLVDHELADVALSAGELLAEMYQELGRGAQWARLLERLEGRIAAAGPSGKRALLRARAFWLNNQGRPREAREAAERALEGASGGEAVIAAVRLAWACKFDGDIEAARAAARRGVDEAGDRPELRAEALRIRAFVDPPHAGEDGIVAFGMEALELHRRSGSAARVVRAVSDLATILMLVGDRHSALERFRSAIRLAEEMGLAHEAMRTRLFATLCRLEQGRYEGVAEELDVLEAAFSGGGAGGFTPLHRLGAACAHALAGRVESALDRLEGLAPFDGPPFSAELGLVMATLGEILWRSAESAERNGESERAEEIRDRARPLIEAACTWLAMRGLDARERACRQLLASA